VTKTVLGTVLILVCGLAGVGASLSIAFILKMRLDAEESRAYIQDIQARTMLTGGLMYVAETSRLGWEREAFGWIDVRDGTAGPKDINGQRLFAADALGNGASFPAAGGKAARCPMQVWNRTPFAIQLHTVYNPIDISDPTIAWKDLLRYDTPDPQPETPPTVTDPVARRAAFENGDRTPTTGSVGLSWFRVYRKPITTSTNPSGEVVTSSPAVFTITCGSGPTQGFRDWDEVVAEGMQDVFGSPQAFADLRAGEILYWYEAEWSPAVGLNVMHHFASDDSYAPQSINTIQPYSSFSVNQAGTFLYIERLTSAPKHW
jgi:hypothetical protein